MKFPNHLFFRSENYCYKALMASYCVNWHVTECYPLASCAM